MTSLHHAFPPVINARCDTLILGSMPGAASLQAGQYYAHPRNLFWPILGRLCDFDPQAPYRTRLARMLEHHIALWDVVACCQRDGSLDSAIVADSIQVHDIASLLASHPRIRRVFFNGSTAERLFVKHFAALVQSPHLHCTRLPSTSPANASQSFEHKLQAWQSILHPRT